MIVVQNQKVWLLEKGRSVSFSYIYSQKEWYKKTRRGEVKLRDYQILSTQYFQVSFSDKMQIWSGEYLVVSPLQFSPSNFLISFFLKIWRFSPSQTTKFLVLDKYHSFWESNDDLKLYRIAFFSIMTYKQLYRSHNLAYNRSETSIADIKMTS